MGIHTCGGPDQRAEGKFTAVILTVLMLILGGQAALAEPRMSPLSAEDLGWDSDWQFQLDDQGQFWLAYYDQSRKLWLRPPEGGEQPLSPSAHGGAPSGLAMTAMPSGMTLMWRDKTPDKRLQLMRSDRLATAPLALGGDTEPLARIQTLLTGQQMHILWLGEKVLGKGEPKHQIYYRSLDLDTMTPTPIERLMPGYYPVWAEDHRNGIMTFSWLYHESPGKILARYRGAGADAFGDPVTVATVPSLSPLMRAFNLQGRWFLLWVGVYPETRVVSLEGAYSDDQGKSWTSIDFGIPGLDVASLSLATDQQGHILLAVSGAKVDDPRKRQDIRLIRSADKGQTWSQLPALRPVNLAGVFDARNPMMAFGPEPGQLLVVWQDWREIRSRLYFSFSRDHGETWVYDNIPLSVDPGTNLRLDDSRESLFFQDGVFHLIAKQARDDAFAATRLVDISFSLDDLAAYAQEGAKLEVTAAVDTVKGQQGATPMTNPPATRSEEALRRRVDASWRAMMAMDFKDTYGMLDPFFRANVDMLTYFKLLGKVTYSSFEIEAVRINGWRAEVDTKVKATIPPFRASTGEMISRPETELTATQVWLWVDDNWYREFYDVASEKQFTRY